MHSVMILPKASKWRSLKVACVMSSCSSSVHALGCPWRPKTPFHSASEVWDSRDDHVAELLALSRNIMIAQAAYRQHFWRERGDREVGNKARVLP